MRIAKFLAGAALVGAPISVISAQSAPQPDSGASHHNGKWIAGASSAAVGAALFLSFTGNGSSDHTSAFTSPPSHAAPSDPGTPTAGATPPAATPPARPGDVSAPSPTDSSVTSAAPGTVDAPAPAGDEPPGDAIDSGTTPPSDSTFVPPNGDQPHENAPPDLDATSTVPEPGSLALTATGIIGLLPLVRRRRR
ncbi:MAG: PEP-CTERM sorting domain-containing protein [Gemmatimonadaceae bacterium]